MRMRSVMPSISVAPFAHLTILQVANFVLHLLFGGARADQLRHAAQVAGCPKLKRLNEQQYADHDEHREAGDPERLRNDGRRFQPGLAARTRSPRLRYDTQPMPRNERKEADQKNERERIKRQPYFLREEHVE